MSHRPSHGGELTTPAPSAKIAASLDDSFEYGAIWTGQSNSLPWGLPEDAFDYSLELTPQPPGLDLTAIIIPDDPDRAVDSVEKLFVDSTVIQSIWDKSTQLRLGTQTAPLQGYADVLRSEGDGINPGLLTVRWRALPPNNQTVSGYLVRENGKWYSYENCRQLTPFLPLRRDIRAPIPGDILRQWSTTHHSPYPVPGGTLGQDGQSLILPNLANGQAPASVVPPDVTTFDDLALYLPMTRREGATGYGISEIADSTFDPATVSAGSFVTGTYYTIVNPGNTDFTLIGAPNSDPGTEFQATGPGTGTGAANPSPLGHPIKLIAPGTPTVITFLNPITAEVLPNAYLLVDWEDKTGTPEAKRSWARVTNNPTDLTFEVANNMTAWLGDGVPATPPASSVGGITWDAGANTATWDQNAPDEGDYVYFTGANVPTELVAGRVYRAINVVGSTHQIAESLDHPPIKFTAPAGDGDGSLTWKYTVWVPHWKDNPFMWIPGPEFAYPNEDQQPRNTFIHWRARGQVFYAWNNQPLLQAAPNTEPFDGVSDSRFGAMLPFCWRTGVAIGRPIRMVSIGIGSTPLAPGHVTNNAAGIFTGTVGWWNHERLGYAVLLEDSSSYMAKRLKRLVTFMAHQALIAEGVTKELRYLSICHIQGEADGFTEAGREFYSAFVNDYRQWLRDLVDEGGWSPFQGEGKMPFAQPLISYDEYQSESGLPWNDREGEINNHIKQVHTQEEFSDYVLVDDLPKENAGHYSGGGMVVLGARLAVSIVDNLEHALAYGSAALTSVNDRLLRICNNALLYVGQGAETITSLEQGTVEANLCKAMLPQATQDLLEMRPWTFAIRREAGAQIKHQHPEWEHCYVVPGRSMAVLEIIPPTTEAGEFPAENRFLPVRLIGSGHRVRADQYLMGRRPAPFVTEGSVSGNELLFTNVEETPADLTQPVPFPNNDLMPERLPNSPTIKYIDKQVDPDRYSSGFTTALTWYLASMLAPALIKGPEGEAAAARHLAKSGGFVRTAASREGMMHEVQPEHEPDWIRARRH